MLEISEEQAKGRLVTDYQAKGEGTQLGIAFYYSNAPSPLMNFLSSPELQKSREEPESNTTLQASETISYCPFTKGVFCGQNSRQFTHRGVR